MPILHNGVKSIIFKCAEILMALFVYKLFSLVAARSNQLTSYFMFAEDYIQRSLFLSSRGLSRASIIVLLFSMLNGLASLYGTLLWALDSPGYIFRDSNGTVADYANYRNNDAPYLLQLNLNSSNLEAAKQNLAQTIGSDLFSQGVNFTLTGEVNRGTPDTTPATRDQMVGPRIWLDGEGFSVSDDTWAMIPLPTQTLDGQKFPTECLEYSSWNCTFNNTFAMPIFKTVIGRPEVHWDDISDQAVNSRYVLPDRTRNIWASFGGGAGSAFMKQVFTVTKGKRRHTFQQSTGRITMLMNNFVPFPRKEVHDFVRRSYSRNETERQSPFIDVVVNGMMKAQDSSMSYYSGVDALTNNNRTLLRSAWGFFTIADQGEDLYSVVMVMTNNITLLRSESLDNAVEPFEPCDLGSYQNEAFGGKVTRTDCIGVDMKTNWTTNSFFGQVDTAAVLIIYGIGSGKSNISAKAFDEGIASWLLNNDDRINSLLMARAYVASIDPALVTVTVKKLVVAMSGLQLFLVALAGLLALLAWLGLMTWADPPWANTFLANLVHLATGTKQANSKLGYMTKPPEITLLNSGSGRNDLLAVSGRPVVLAADVSALRAEESSEKDRLCPTTREAAMLE